MRTGRADVAVVGGGVLGLAIAYEAARRGKSVVLFERDGRAEGASVRNFGMIWPVGQPVGQPAGERYDMAIRSRERWLGLGRDAGIWVDPCGSLHVAYKEDELAVLEAFAVLDGRPGEMLTPRAAREKSPGLRADGLLGAWWSPTELAVSPRVNAYITTDGAVVSA